MKCDVLIVGAGPAGSSAAHACAAAGLDTIFIDRKKEVGVPVSCSGAIGSYLIPLLPFKIPKSLLEWKLDGLEFFVNDVSLIRKGGPWTSHAIDRSSFDAWLAERAQAAGAELFLETELIDLRMDDNQQVTKAVVKKKGRTREVEFSVLIGADGVDSRVLEKLGERKRDARLGRAAVYEFEGVNLESPTMDQLYFGDFAPGGYAHIFPLSQDRANIGVGSIVEGVDIKRCFEEFLKVPRVRVQIKGARTVKEKSGVVPFDHQSDNCQYGNVLLAGDAASQNIKPLVEGFLPSIICGDIAGKAAARHLLTGAPLQSYQSNVERVLGLVFKESDKLIEVLEEISELKGKTDHLLIAGVCSNVLSPKDIDKLKGAGYEEVKRQLISWNKSRTKQVLVGLYERVAILYLLAQRWANSKIYKL